MSRPYLQINPTYNSTTDVVTLDILALRMRGINSLVLTGLSASQTINLSNGYFNGSTTYNDFIDEFNTTNGLGYLLINILKYGNFRKYS